MITCPYCAHDNQEGELFCEECGQPLFGEGATAIATRKLAGATNQLDGKNAWGTARFGQNASILLHIRDNPQPVEIQPQEETILGRHDSSSPSTPTIDLTAFGAYEHGVSRIHAAIRRGEDTLTLVDLGSVNGTHLNGQRLIPNQPRVLRDGDEIRLGRLVCHIFFKTTS
jgi:pSer/pThr/pTyr-binding forkhead associated (FHA) protein